MTSSATAAPSRRAAPLSPKARRAALIHATLPLIRRYGVDVSTREIAAAAGVAEGTIFRVFSDKDSLIQAALEAAFDPAPAVAALQQVDLSAPLEARLTTAARIVQARFTTVINLMMMLQGNRACGERRHLKPPRSAGVIDLAIARLIEPDREQLRVPPAQAARLLRLLLVSGSHPRIAEGKLLTPEEIVGIILDGVRTRPFASSTTASSKSRALC